MMKRLLICAIGCLSIIAPALADSDAIWIRISTEYANVNEPATNVGFEYTTIDGGSNRVHHTCVECLTNDNGQFDIFVDSKTIAVILHFNYRFTPIINMAINQEQKISDLSAEEIDGKIMHKLPCEVMRQPDSIDSDSRNVMWEGYKESDKLFGVNVGWTTMQAAGFMDALAGAYPTSGKILIAQDLVERSDVLAGLSSQQAEYLTALAGEDVAKVKLYEAFVAEAMDNAVYSTEKTDFVNVAALAGAAGEEIGISAYAATDAYVGAAIRYELIGFTMSRTGADEAKSWAGYSPLMSGVLTSVVNNPGWVEVAADTMAATGDADAYDTAAGPVSSLHSATFRQ